MAKNQTNEVNVSREIKELMDSGIALNRLPKLIEQMYRANLNLFVWGDPGIGIPIKSAGSIDDKG